METTDLEIKAYISSALEEQHFLNCKITLTDSTEKSDGYASYVIFATVEATTKNSVKKDIQLAIKISRRNLMEIHGELYFREAYFYETILREFTKFQTENNIKSIFQSIPKCYKTIIEEDTVVVVMENLRKNGYSLYNSKKPLDLDHLKLVLREYGKFHAISFAMKKKRKDVFEKLSTNLDDLTLKFFKHSFRDTINHSMKEVCNILKEMDETELYEMCDKICQRGAAEVTFEMMESIEPETACLHGDCWNNNFVYKYEPWLETSYKSSTQLFQSFPQNNKEKYPLLYTVDKFKSEVYSMPTVKDSDHNVPSNVVILDWQFLKVHSPALDLSYFIYCNSSEEQLKHFDELLGVYHASFSIFLTEMGCDAEKLFSYSTLLKHWKKYSLFGVIIVTTWLRVVLCDKEDAPNFADFKDGKAICEEIMNVQIKDEIKYRERLVAVLNHYYKYSY